jgi:hypothetical protein
MRRYWFLLVVGAVLAHPSLASAQAPGALPKSAYAAPAAAPDLKGGIAFSPGAFDLSANPEAMILGNLGFPKGIGFIHDKLTYYSEYTDPTTGMKGYLYSLPIGAKTRFFLVGQNPIPGVGGGSRWIFEYDDTGAFLAQFQGTFAAKP